MLELTADLAALSSSSSSSGDFRFCKGGVSLHLDRGANLGQVHVAEVLCRLIVNDQYFRGSPLCGYLLCVLAFVRRNEVHGYLDTTLTSVTSTVCIARTASNDLNLYPL